MVKTTVESAPHSVPTLTGECVKVGRMWPSEAAVRSCGSARVHTSAECWTCPVAVPTQIMVADGLMLVNRATLVR